MKSPAANLGFIIILSVFALGCSNSQSINRWEEMTLSENAIIYTNDGKQILVEHTEIKQDSVHATEFPSGVVFHLDASQINRITLKKSNALKYSILSAAGTVGWVVLTQDNWNDDSNSGYTFFWSGVMGGVAGGAGYLVGSMQTDEHTIRFMSNEVQGESQTHP